IPRTDPGPSSSTVPTSCSGIWRSLLFVEAQAGLNHASRTGTLRTRCRRQTTKHVLVTPFASDPSRLLEWPPSKRSTSRVLPFAGVRFSTPAGPGWRLGVVGGSEATVDVVVDHADVLHE